MENSIYSIIRTDQYEVILSLQEVSIA